MADETKTAALPVEKELAKIPGAKPGPRMDAWWWVALAVLALVIFLILVHPDPYRRIWAFIVDGIGRTVYITIISFFAILFVGLLGALGRLSKIGVIRVVATMYVEIIRGIPLLVQLIWWYYAFPALIRTFGATKNIPFLANYLANGEIMAIVGLTVGYGAYMTEIYRAGIQSIPHGQMEAARSLGMNYFQSMRYIILPQALRVVLPPIGNEFTALLKDSSLVSVVSVSDLTRRGREFMAIYLSPIEVWNFVALVYLTMTLFSSRMANWIERKTSSGERRG